MLVAWEAMAIFFFTCVCFFLLQKGEEFEEREGK